MSKNPFYLIIHGHFYQPPREEPWTDEIDRQPSAFPFHDWNERINKECYAANAASRVLDEKGRILDIINNYEKISFNFGPTLIKWLKKKAPFTYERIIEADRTSRKENNGHGNAIAQVYNHIIMPLASNRDQITEIEWGIRSFQKDFGRTPEGLWLPETAINDIVAEHLISFGIKFIILSPTQAKEIKHIKEEHWKDVSNGTIDPSQPYLLQEKNGSIAVFFYYPKLAHKISFEHLLQNVEFLRQEILSYRIDNRPNFLVHTATDGESYGHHEPFGDMCLARLIYENKARKDFIFTNYGNFLEMNPPQYLVRLKKGDDGIGTSWSCVHGVGRWYKDCGCSTGGKPEWNQKWRTPLREAFDLLRDSLHEFYEKQASSCFKDVWHARNEYIKVILAENANYREIARKEFLKECLIKNECEINITKLMKIMEALHNALLMYTSCGWFFSDISGIETTQNLKYALRVFELSKDFLPEETKRNFLNILSRAKSNIPENKDGKWIFENIEKSCVKEEKIIFEYFLSIVLRNHKICLTLKEQVYNHLVNYSISTRLKKRDWFIYKTFVKITDLTTLEEKQFIAYLLTHGENCHFFIKRKDSNIDFSEIDKDIEREKIESLLKIFHGKFGEDYQLKDLSHDGKEFVLKKIFKNPMKELHRNINKAKRKIEDYITILNLYHELDVLLPENDWAAIKELFNDFIIEELKKLDKKDFSEQSFHLLSRMIKTAKSSNMKIDYQDILAYLRNYVLNRMNEAIIKLNIKELNHLEKLIDFTNLAGIDFEKYEIQNLLYIELLRIANQYSSSKINSQVIQILLRLANKFNIVTEEFEKRLY